MLQIRFSGKNFENVINAAAKILLSGGVLVYPTETYYGIGCLADNAVAVTSIYKIKQRAVSKAMPLLAGSLAQVAQVADLRAAPAALLSCFWPGPLTVLLPAIRKLPGQLVNGQGRVAIRVSSSRFAVALANACNSPLTASSANISGRPPAASLDGLDAELVTSLSSCGLPCALLDAGSSGNSQLPSTILQPVLTDRQWRLRILREGAIDRQMLTDKNFLLTD